MPTYRYECQACGHQLEEFQSMTAEPLRKCPSCKKSKLDRLIGPGAAVLFKGGGFYQTDYRSSSYQAGAKAESATPANCTGEPKSCAANGGPCAAPNSEKKD